MKQYRAVCPLLNFQLQWQLLIGKHSMTKQETLEFFKERHKQVVEGIELVEGIKIRLFSNKDIEDFKSPISVAFTDLNTHFSTRTFLLEKTIGVEDEHKDQTAKIMRKIILALRLLKEGHFYGDDVFCFDAEKGHFISWSREGPPLTSDRLGSGYAIDLEEISSLITLINRIQSVDFERRKGLDLACKRFQRAYQEYDYNDRLIDYMIAFEALFLRGEKRASSRGKIISIACSALLGNNNEEREKIKNTLITAYSMRNCIVHGGEYRKDLNPFTIIDSICDYLRESIIKFLD